MKIRHIGLVTVLLAALVAASPALAGAKLKINDTSEIDFGLRLQALFLSDQSDIDLDGQLDDVNEFRVRRARLRVKATIGEHVEVFLQSEAAATAGTGLDMRLIDGFITLKKNSWAQFVVGLNMAPASRQNLTSSGALMAIDRPGNAYKSLTWGTRVLRSFSNKTYVGSTGNFATPVAVRDTGGTFFGSGKLGEKANIKYYAGVYDGNNAPGEDSFRMTGRVQVNLWDAEAGYYNLSTYLGKKKTLAFGVSLDQQKDAGRVGIGAEPGVIIADYSYYSIDAFLELPFGEGRALTAEAAYSALDFDDNQFLLNSQGNGYYLQAGYYINKWQPWFELEKWESDRPDKQGNADIYRLGVTYFIQGHNANIKFAYENFSTDVPFVIVGNATEDSADAFVVGFYTTY